MLEGAAGPGLCSCGETGHSDLRRPRDQSRDSEQREEKVGWGTVWGELRAGMGPQDCGGQRGGDSFNAETQAHTLPTLNRKDLLLQLLLDAAEGREVVYLEYVVLRRQGANDAELLLGTVFLESISHLQQTGS